LSREDDPLISIITVNWNGKKYLADLFYSISKLDYPQDRLQVIMVDNGSDDGSAGFVRKKFPGIEIVEPGENRGYAGGNNEGLRRAQGEYIALINNDCIVDPGWLREMLSIYEMSSEDSKIGAVGPRVVFYWPFLPLQIISASRDSGKDMRRLGIKILDAKVRCPGSYAGKKTHGNRRASSEIKYVEGFYPPELDSRGETFRWTQGNALMGVPIFDNDRETCLEIKLSSEISPNKVSIVIGGEILEEIKVGKRPGWVKLIIAPEFYTGKKDIINSCGVKINRSLYSMDRGFMNFDEGQYNRVEEVFALSGSSFMMDRRMIEEAGSFDSYFFTYYEDIDLLWRARLKGWKHFFTPNALVRHHHCGSGSEWSYDFTYHVLLNRLLMIYKCGWFTLFARSQAAFAAAGIIHAFFYIARLLMGRKTERIDIGIRFKIFFRLKYLLLLFLPRRIRIRKGKKISDFRIREWFRDF
jgi:GT2 family glycosyltransferase